MTASAARKRVAYCSWQCAGAADSRRRLSNRFGPAVVTKTVRRDLDRAAAGLNEKARRKLLAEWRRKGLPCAYCHAPAETVDHVVPLVRGGTNYEGNLVPACRSCNSSKSDHLLVEWRWTCQRSSAPRVA